MNWDAHKASCLFFEYDSVMDKLADLKHSSPSLWDAFKGNIDIKRLEDLINE